MKRQGVWLVGLALVLAMGGAIVFAQAPVVGGTDEPMAARGEADTGSLWKLYKESMPEGGIITGLSIWMIAIILTNALTLRHRHIIPPDLVEQTDELLRKKQAKAALSLCQGNDSLVGRMMAAGISRVGRGFQPAMDYLAEVGQEEAMKMNHKLSYLSVIGSISPMLGLMGTVRGMIGAFAQLASSGAQPSPAQLSGNIQLALVTTFEGLLVAVPALFAYSLFRNHLARAVTEADMVVGELMSRFQGVTAPLSRLMKPAAPAAEDKPEPSAPPAEPEKTDEGGGDA